MIDHGRWDFDPPRSVYTCPSQASKCNFIFFSIVRLNLQNQQLFCSLISYVTKDKCTHAYGSAPPVDLCSSIHPNLKIFHLQHTAGETLFRVRVLSLFELRFSPSTLLSPPNANPNRKLCL